MKDAFGILLCDGIDSAEGEEGGSKGGEGGEEVHSLGDFAEGDEGLGEFSEQGDEGVARWMGKAKLVGDDGVFGGVAEDGGGG